MRKRTRIAAVGAAAALVAGGSGVAVASASASPAAAKKSCAVAKEKLGVGVLHVSRPALKAALRDAEAASTPRDGLLAPAAVAAVARDLHVSGTQAQKLLRSIRLVNGSAGRREIGTGDAAKGPRSGGKTPQQQKAALEHVAMTKACRP